MGKKRIKEAIQQHLFSHPVYRWADKAEERMCVLVVGDTEYAELFVDLCLQTGQMTDRRIVVFWCIADEAVKERYLCERPAFKTFLSVDGKWTGQTYAPYGELHFKPQEAYLDDEISDAVRYVFIAEAQDKQNAETAALFKHAAKHRCLAAYLSEDRVKIFISDDSVQEQEDAAYAEGMIPSKKELERMAFNTHRIWEGTGNLDYEKAKERFLQPYNHDASVSFVLSIPYKLQSAGIDAEDPEAAADALNRLLRGEENKPGPETEQWLQKLSALEHRRWVIERVCEGTGRLVDKNGNPEYVSCAERGSVKKKDKNGKVIMHPCLVHGTEQTPLQSAYYQKHAHWDKKSTKDVELDDLDAMSVNLHRAMKNAADRLRNNTEALDRDLAFLKKTCSRDVFLKRDFDRYHFCIKNILDNSESYAAQFETYEKTLISRADTMPDEDGNALRDAVESIRKKLFPVLEANMYHDYKKYDSDLITHIPFILTGRNDVHICTSLGAADSRHADNQDVFSCVASATALYAAKITYLFHMQETTNLSLLSSRLKAIRNYFEYRGRSCEIIIKAFGPKDKPEKSLRDVLIKAKSEKTITSFSVETCSDTDELITKVSDAVLAAGPDYFDGSSLFTSSAWVNGKITDAVIKQVPYFEFNSEQKRFFNLHRCGHLAYTRLSSFLQIEDMFALMNATDKEYNYPDCADIYRDLWEIYCGDAIGEQNFPLCAGCWTKVTDLFKQNGLKVMQYSNLKITGSAKEKKVIRKMLQEMEQKKYLKDLDIEGFDIKSVTIRNKKFKRICMMAGSLLEAYVYYEACKTDWFDDVQTGYKFRWERDDVTNELDCVLTKDYRSVLVECKSRREADESFYLTLDSLADHFGINYKKVLILTADSSGDAAKTHISRGKQMDIITISEKKDLDSIGERLKEIMLSSGE